MEQTTLAIILNRRESREYDRQVMVLTQNLGRLWLWARGIRKPGAKLLGQLELFTLVKLRLAKKTIIGSRTIDSFPLVRENIEKAEQALEIAEVIERFVPLGAGEADLFDMVSLCLASASFDGFQDKFLSLMGFDGARPKNLNLFLKNRLH